MGAGDLNFGHFVCTMSIFLTEPFPKPPSLSFLLGPEQVSAHMFPLFLTELSEADALEK